MTREAAPRLTGDVFLGNYMLEFLKLVVRLD